MDEVNEWSDRFTAMIFGAWVCAAGAISSATLDATEGVWFFAALEALFIPCAVYAMVQWRRARRRYLKSLK